MASTFHLAVSDASMFSLVLVVIASQRRTTHPSGSRLVEKLALRPAPCPWHICAPENHRYPAVSKREDHTGYGYSTSASPLVAHDRGVANLTSGSQAISKGLRVGLITGDGLNPVPNPASDLSPNS